MLSTIRRSMRAVLGIEFLKTRSLQILLERGERLHELERQMDLVRSLEVATGSPIAPWLEKSHSQIGQDVFAAAMSGFKRNGYFVEFGATDGVSLSNTYMLERELGWTGILAEPARTWHDDLLRHRGGGRTMIDHDCVMDTTGDKLTFREVSGVRELSTVGSYIGADMHASHRDGIDYPVVTVTLLDLLERYSAPRSIDYLSIDTEGSEFTILNSFDFDRYDIKIITCEHNYSPNRGSIQELLLANGYRRMFDGVSAIDDWYVRL